MMRSKFDEQLDRLNKEMMKMGSAIEDSIRKAVDALVKQDAELAKKVMIQDEEIDREQKTIESICFNLLIQQQPVAKDLRTITAALKMVTDMERIGDQAADIGEITIKLANQPYIKKLEHINQMASETMLMLIRSIEAYVEKDMDKARKVIAYDDVTDSEIKLLLEEDLNEFKLDINRLNQFCNEMLSKNDKLFEKVDNTEWKKKRIAIQNKYVSVMQNLQDNGLDTVKLDTLMEQRNNKKEEIDRILIKEKELCKLEAEYESLESVYRNKVDIIYKLRNDFIQEVIGNDKNVKFQLAKNRNRNSFINTLKAIMQKEITSVDDDINELADLY